MLLNPAWTTLLRRKAPLVKVLDVRSDDTDQTTYTFTNCHIGEIGLGSHEAQLAYQGGLPGLLRSPSTSGIVVVVHGEDDAALFGVNTVSIGGVSGTERVDRGGATNPVNTAIYTWAGGQLADIPNTDVVVTWTESILACAIGILGVYNIGQMHFIDGTAGTTTGTGTATGTISADTLNQETHTLVIGGSTCVTGGGSEVFYIDMIPNASASGGYAPTILYNENSTEIDFAAFWLYIPQYVGTNGIYRMLAGWSGTGATDAASIAIV